jgi:hypothetical protein
MIRPCQVLHSASAHRGAPSQCSKQLKAVATCPQSHVQAPTLTCCCSCSTATRQNIADMRMASKYQAHVGHLHPGYTFVPASVESYGHLGGPIMRHLPTLSDIASGHSLAVTRGSFLACAHRKLSVALVQSQGDVYRSCALLLAKASGRQLLPGADTPFLD